MNIILSDILGYIGAFFLIIRLTPIIREQLNEPSKINLYFLGMEFAACMFLGSSAFLIQSVPFIVANILSFMNLMIIIYVQIRIRCLKNGDDGDLESNTKNNKENDMQDIQIVVP